MNRISKNILRSISLITLVMAFALNGQAATITSDQNGNWNSSSTWDLGRTPADNDVVVVASGTTVTVSNNPPTYNNMRIEIYGSLWFNNGRKINLAADGQVQIFAGGDVDGSNGGSKILIAGTSVWDGNDGVISGPAFVEDGMTGFGAGVLPVELMSFTARRMDDASVQLFWSTASELDNSHFTIERTLDGEYFEEIDQMDGTGNSSEQIDYAFVDDMAPNTLCYYRLKQVDFDGEFSYSDVISAEASVLRMAEVNVFPNPSNGENVNFEMTGLDQGQEVLVVLRDIYGKEVYSKVIFSDGNGEVFTAVDAEMRLDPGTYVIIGSTNDKLYSKRLVIK